MKKLITLLLTLSLLPGPLTAVISAGDFPFTDVKESRWSRKSIEYAYEMKYMDGVGDGKFDPAGSMTRGMAVTVLYRKEGSPAVTWSDDFSDVKAGKYYSNAVIWAKMNNIVNGVSEGKFDPNGKITREQLAAILYRFAEYAGLDRATDGDLSKFPDASKAHKYAKDALAWAVGTGLIGGVKSGEIDLLDPAGFATREQFAAIIERFDGYAASSEEVLTEADFYVSTRGNDSWNGSFARPFRTIGRAILAVREVEKTPEKGSVTVAVRTGEYYNFDYDLTWKDSGAADCPVIYKAYGDGPVRIHDVFTVTADEFGPLSDGEKSMFKEKARDHVLVADISDRFPVSADPLSFVVTGGNGRLDLCRNPNRYADGEDNFIPFAVDTAGKDSLKIVNALLSRTMGRYASTEGMMLYGHFSYGSFPDMITVGDFDRENGTVTPADLTEITSYPWVGGFRFFLNDDGTVNTDKTMTGENVVITNMPEDLDFAGEYYLDRRNGKLYVYDPAGDYVFSESDDYLDTEAEYVTFEGIEIDNLPASGVYEIPVVYLDKEGDDGFKVLNLSDPQLSDNEWSGNAGRILTETVQELVETEHPDLITISGDLAWGNSIGSIGCLSDLMASTGVPWAPVMGNHDNEATLAVKEQKTDILKSRDGCLFEWGDGRLGWGNYVIVLRQNGVPVHGLIMMDTHANEVYIDSAGDDHYVYDDLSDEQILWYGDVCDMLTEMGVPETSVIFHIPCYTYREAWDAAFLPGLDPKSVPAGDGMQVGCWAEGYEDSFGVVHEDGIASSDKDNGFFDAVLAHGSTKTLLSGHDHINNFSVSYRGVRFVYSLKTGSGCYWEPEMSGGTLLDISSDGHATTRHHYVAVD